MSNHSDDPNQTITMSHPFGSHLHQSSSTHSTPHSPSHSQSVHSTHSVGNPSNTMQQDDPPADNVAHLLEGLKIDTASKTKKISGVVSQP